MPNHVINQVIFRGIDRVKQLEISDAVTNAACEIDFGTLVPMPPNAWMGNVGQKHEKAFKVQAMDWARHNWGTKWNAYGLDQGGRYESVAFGDDSLTLTFQTAWSPPYGWLAALLNRFKLSFDHNWFDEGCERGVHGSFKSKPGDTWETLSWDEEPADDVLHRHLHKLLFGVEQFGDEDAA
jgi:hypothetical protein